MSERIDLTSQCAGDAVAVTPADTVYPAVTYNPPLTGLYIGGAGNVAVKGRSGSVVIFYNVPAGTILPINVYSVMSTGTTATSITGFEV